jgi:hypothetical protein
MRGKKSSNIFWEEAAEAPTHSELTITINLFLDNFLKEIKSRRQDLQVVKRRY